MLIAFEGPDNVGKSYAADKLGAGWVTYRADEDSYLAAARQDTLELGIVQCFDRVGWITDLVYRLALPDREWPGTPHTYSHFAMPDAHLVFKLYRLGLVPADGYEEGYSHDEILRVNEIYHRVARFLARINEEQDYKLFKTISVLQVVKPEAPLRLTMYSSPLSFPFEDPRTKNVNSDLSLLDLLTEENALRL